MSNSINTTFWHQWKDQKSSYQEKQILAPFYNLFALILVLNSAKNFWVTQNVKEIKF